MLSVGTIRFEDRFSASRKGGQGEVGVCTALADSPWQLLQLAEEWPWSALGGLFFCFLVQTSVENGRGSISGFSGSFQSGGAFLGWRALTTERSEMSGCDQGHEPAKNL